MTVRRLFLQFPNSEHALFDLRQEYTFSKGLWSLTGHSGVGKTSFLRLLSGWFSDEEMHEVSWEAEMDWEPFADVDFIGNDPSLLPWKRVGANIELRAPGASQQDIEATIAATGLNPAVLRARPYELSLGMYKRIEFTAALLEGRKLLLLDEFFGSLDADSRQRCFDLVRERRQDKVTIISTHSPETLPADGLRTIKMTRADSMPTVTSLELGVEV